MAHTGMQHVIVVPVSMRPLDDRIKIEATDFAIFMDVYDGRALATAITVACADVELARRRHYEGESSDE
jgi:hypothetical protein